MQSQTIMTGGPYELVSYGNGTAYDLRNHSNDNGPAWSVFVQGDDAGQFRDEIAAIEGARPDMPTRDVLGAMWCAYWQGEGE